MTDILHNKKILVLEDEVLIGMDLAMMLGEDGAEVFHAASLGAALGYLETATPDTALVDVSLGRGETCKPVVDVLKDRDIPFVLHTGDLDRLGEFVSTINAPILRKPSAPQEVRLSLAKVLSGA